jgi:hypothetical protein
MADFTSSQLFVAAQQIIFKHCGSNNNLLFFMILWVDHTQLGVVVVVVLSLVV